MSLCTFRDDDAKFNTSLRIVGGKLTANGKAVASLNDRTWYNVAAVFNFSDLTYNVYVDNKLVAEEIEFQNPDIGPIMLNRTTFSNGNGTGKFLIDNYCIYEGMEPRTFTEEDFKVDTN